MKIINNTTVKVDTSEELKNILENDNKYNYIYLGNDITLESGININESKEKIIINGTYLNIRYKLTGMDSINIADTINVNARNKQIQIKNMNIEYTNIFGILYAEEKKEYSDVVMIYDNITFIGTKLSYNPYGTIKITDSNIDIKSVNSIEPQEVCESNIVIIGGNTNISSASINYPLFRFRNDTTNPSVIFLCKSRIIISTDTREFMNNTNKLNFTILHDTELNLTTGNGFTPSPNQGANNVLIEERATLNFIEKSHQRIPMWAIFGNFTMKEDSNLSLINSFDTTPSDNYNLHFKGANSKLILDNPKSVVIYTKNSNVIYTDNPLTFSIKSKRINMWNNSTPLNSAGGIDNLPDYYWYKENGLIKFEGVVTNTQTAITSHNLTKDELSKLSDIGNFSFQSKKQFSMGGIPTNIHEISTTRNKISGHTMKFCDVLIKYNNVVETVTADSDGLFEYNLTNAISNDTNVEITSNNPGSFIYETRKITTPHNGELCLMSIDNSFTFSLMPISTTPVILPKNKDLLIEVVDSRVNSSDWKLYSYIDNDPTSQLGYKLGDSLIFKKLDDTIIRLNNTKQLVYTGKNNDGEPLKTSLTYSKEKGPLLDLTDNALEVNEEYFSNLYFKIEE